VIDQAPGVAARWHTHLEYLEAATRDEPFDFTPRFNELQPRYAERLEEL
jgi:hypothetical protein